VPPGSVDHPSVNLKIREDAVIAGVTPDRFGDGTLDAAKHGIGSSSHTARVPVYDFHTSLHKIGPDESRTPRHPLHHRGIVCGFTRELDCRLNLRN
jgi:hypothetical protein